MDRSAPFVVPDTAATDLPRAVASKMAGLSSGAAKWQEMPDADRAKVARACRAQMATMDMEWVPDNLKCLGLEPSQADANKTLSFDPFLFLATLADRLDKIAESFE